MRRSAAVVALLLGCAVGSAAEEGVRTLRGKVVAVGKGRAEGETLVTIEVAAGAADEYSLVISSETRLERGGKRKEPAKASEIKVGMDVEAVCSKIVMASIPPLVPKVRSIVILEKKE
jgi:hypothetical protein